MQKITQAMVFQVAEKLQAQGHKVTVAKVREKLKRGSTTTVHRYIKAWRARPDVIESPKALNSKLVEQQKINQSLTQEMLTQSQAFSDAKKQIEVLQQQNTKLAEDLSATRKERDVIRSTYQQQIETLQNNFEQSLKQMAEQIQTINAHAIDQVVAAGHHFDEQIIEERMEIRELKEQLNMPLGQKKLTHVE